MELTPRSCRAITITGAARSRLRHALPFAALLLTTAQGAELVELNPTADTFIAEYYPDKNFGAMTYLNGGTTQNYTTNRGLMKFNPASVIPGGSKILSVSLITEVTGQPDEPWNSALFGLHRMLCDWGEGDNTGSLPRNAAAAGTNEACWTHRFAFTPGTWGQPGGQAGVDYSPDASTLTWVYQAGEPYAFESTPELVDDVQLWLDQPGTNFGWMLIAQNEIQNFTARRFGSRESALDAPRLAVEYQPPPPIDSITAATGHVLLDFVAPPGFAYQVQFRDDLLVGSWQSYPPIGPYTNAAPVSYAVPMAGAQRFYRLKVY